MKNSTPTWKPTHLINLAAIDFLSKRLTWPTDWEISCMINCGLIRRRTIYQMKDWLNDTLNPPTQSRINGCFIWLIDRHGIKQTDKVRWQPPKYCEAEVSSVCPFALFTADILRSSACLIPTKTSLSHFPSDAATDSSFYFYRLTVSLTNYYS